MRDLREGICELCDGREVIVAAPIEYSAEQGEPWTPLAVSREWGDGWLAGPHPLPGKRFGALSVCVCRACGYTQWFASEPAEIPIGDEFRTSLVKGPPRGGYR